VNAVLLVNHPAFLLERLGGMSVLERQAFLLSRAGFKRLRIAAHRPDGARLAALRWPEGLDCVWSSESSPPEAPYAAVSADHLIRLDALREIASTPHEKATAYLDPAGRSVVQVVPRAQERSSPMERRALPEGASVLLQTPLEREVIPWLLREAVKPHDSFMARHFDRRISLALTRRLLDTRITANQMTVFSILVGLAGAFLMAGGRAAMTAGVLLVWAHTVLDGCDGELARLRYEQSRVGGILDFWGDNVVHAALFLSLGIGIARRGLPVIHLLLGLCAAAGALGAAWSVYLHSSMRRTRHGPLFNGLEDLAPESASAAVRNLAFVEDILARRDFIYLLVFLVLIGYPEIFLWAAGVGTPMFLAALLYLRRIEEQGRIHAVLRRQSS
jgi:phosphatidylglycerophosphate synthase